MIRPYQDGDHEAIAEIFPRAVHEIGREAYTAEQCAAWSGTKPNPAHWQRRCAEKRPLVFEVEGRVVGFLELEADGHIDCLYVDPDVARQGVASRLIDRAVADSAAAGLERVFVEASLCARPVFEKKGFRVAGENQVRIGTEELVNYRMELWL